MNEDSMFALSPEYIHELDEESNCGINKLFEDPDEKS